MKLIPLKYDFCIKEVMENETVRKHFISDVLAIPLKDIRSVRMINPFLWKRYKKQKLGILDIQLTLNDDTKINIEMQLKQKAFWKERTVFYLAKMFTADLRRGEDYKAAKKCIAITILDFNIDTKKAYHNVYMLCDKNGELYTDVLELHTIELKKNPSKEQPSPLDEWHSLFNAKTEEELDMIKSRTKNLGIIEAVKELKEISLTDRLRYEHEIRLKAKRDRRAEDMFVYESGRKAGREDGLKAGREEGLKAGREESMKILVSTLREHGDTDEQIVGSLMEKYGLSQEEAEGKFLERNL